MYYILENDRVLVLWRSKRDIVSCLSLRFLYFPIFKLCLIWAVQNSSRVIFNVLDEKLTQKHVSHRPNPKFSAWPFLDLATLNDLDLENDHWLLRMVLRSVSDTIRVIVLTYFHFIRHKKKKQKENGGVTSKIVRLQWNSVRLSNIPDI